MQNHDESEETAYTHTWIPAIKCFHFNTLEMACYPLRLRFLNSNNIHQSFLRAISEIALFSTETKRFLSMKNITEKVFFDKNELDAWLRYNKVSDVQTKARNLTSKI